MLSSVHVMAALVSLFVITAAVLDLRTKKIPNWVTVPAAILGLAFHAAVPQASGILWSLAGFGIGFALLLLPWLLGGGGMGDVKLLAALGAWLGPLVILVVFGASAVLAAVMAATVMVSGVFTSGIYVTRKRYLDPQGAAAAGVLGKPRRVIPFAVPVAVCTIVVMALMVIQATVRP